MSDGIGATVGGIGIMIKQSQPWPADFQCFFAPRKFLHDVGALESATVVQPQPLWMAAGREGG